MSPIEADFRHRRAANVAASVNPGVGNPPARLPTPHLHPDRPTAWTAVSATSVLPDDPHDHALHAHIPRVGEDRLHGGVRGLEPYATAGLAVELLHRGRIAA